MADKVVVTRADDGTAVPVTHVNQGDGTYAVTVAAGAVGTAAGSDKFVVLVATDGTAVKMRYIDQGDGTYARICA